MKYLYELERTITDELSRFTPDVDGDPADTDFVETMARRIHERHIRPLVDALTEAALACNQPNSSLCRRLNNAIAKAGGRP